MEERKHESSRRIKKYNKMKLQDQVTSVKISNKIHELGVTAPSLFFRDSTKSEEYQIDRWSGAEGDYCLDNVNCYTVAELGEMLPSYIKLARLHENDDGLWYLYIYKDDANMWRMNYNRWANTTIPTMLSSKEENEADLRGKMLIYLLENNLLKI